MAPSPASCIVLVFYKIWQCVCESIRFLGFHDCHGSNVGELSSTRLSDRRPRNNED